MNCNAWKLTRVEPREQPRTDWPDRWQAAGDSVNWQGALKDEFIALKNSPIWHALGQGVGGFDDATQSDSPPFAINSGMGWLGVSFQTESKVVNRKSSLANEKGQTTVNQPNKVNLILLIAQRFTDDMCANVLESFNNHPLLIANKLVNEAANWDESKHPRARDGKFASVPGDGKRKVPKIKDPDDNPNYVEFDDEGNEIPPDEIKRRDFDMAQYDDWRERKIEGQGLRGVTNLFFKRYDTDVLTKSQVKKLPRKYTRDLAYFDDAQEIDNLLDEAEKIEKSPRKGKGHTPREIKLLQLLRIERESDEKPGWKMQTDKNGKHKINYALSQQLDVLFEIHNIEDIDAEKEKEKAKSRDLNHKRYARLNDLEDELTRMVETYGTDGLTGKIKKDGTSADEKTRKAYKALQREQKKLERQIDWQALDEEPDVDDSTRSLEDDNYRPDDPPSRTPEAADEADREMFREWTKNIPREKWTKDMQAEYKRLFGKR